MTILQTFRDSRMNVSTTVYFTSIAAVSIVGYLVALATYRLYWSPLAKFPGPKLAALTQWVETYHELRGDQGRFFYVIEQWHNKYGPIIRISPSELHVRDSEFYEIFYSSSRPADRLARLRNRFGAPDSTHFTVAHGLHRQRRAALNPFFSKRTVNSYSPSVQRSMNRLCDHLKGEYTGNGKPLVLDDMWGCLASDIIGEYCFGKVYNFIETREFRSTFVRAMHDLLDPLHIMTQFPWIMQIIMLLPDWLNIMLQPKMRSLLEWRAELRLQIIEIMHSKPASETGKQNRTVFSTILNSSLPSKQLTVTRLEQEALTVVGAGAETVSRALTVASFHIISNPTVLSRLHVELKSAIPNPAEIPLLEELQQLPYLTACIEETLRISVGTTQRSPRVFPGHALAYKDHLIPASTPISMDIRDVLLDPVLFPSPNTFEPERWLGLPLSPTGKPYSRYMVAFARGPRNCLGMHLAYAELYIGLATLFRRFEMELWETGRESVDIWMDRFVPRPRPGTKGVRVLIK